MKKTAIYDTRVKNYIKKITGEEFDLKGFCIDRAYQWGLDNKYAYSTFDDNFIYESTNSFKTLKDLANDIIARKNL